MAKIILHLKSDDVSNALKGWHLELYKVIRTMAEDAGVSVDIRARDADIRVGTRAVSDGRFDDGNLHIIDDRSVKASNVLNAGVAYFWRFWHLDPLGVKAFSSIGDRTYDPDLMPLRRAEPFYNKMYQRYVLTRRSKYGQPTETRTFPSNAVSVFFQGKYPISSGATKFDDIQMLEVVLEQTDDRPIIVKPHPLASSSFDVSEVRRLIAKDERVIVTDANVHDILKSSCATISINSTVALEGFLHNVPAVLFGKSDFHQFSGSILDADTFKATLAEELERKAGYTQFLAWYFLRNCLSLNSGRLIDRIWDAFETVGFPKERFETHHSLGKF